MYVKKSYLVNHKYNQLVSKIVFQFSYDFSVYRLFPQDIFFDLDMKNRMPF